MKRLLIAMLALSAGAVVGCVDASLDETFGENHELLLDDSENTQNIVYGELVTETGECSPGDIIRCFSGPKDKANVGICKAGYFECVYEEDSGKWVWDATECKDEVLPDYTYPCSSEEPDADFDCNGVPDNMQDEDGDGLTICSDEGFRDDMCDILGGCDGKSSTKERRSNKLKALWVNNYPYTGGTQTVTLQAGTYKFEVWGAQGGGRNLGINNCSTSLDVGNGGLGGYAAGTITLKSTTTVYINVGGAGSCASSGVAAGGFNCGVSTSDCTGHAGSSGEPGGGGGGATDIRIGSTSLYSRVIVAGGGGGGGEDSGDSYGHGGGLVSIGGNSTYIATQTAAGVNGYFGRGASTGVGDGGGGGGGWYGGGTLKYTNSEDSWMDTQGGGGGSGYVYTSATASNYPAGCTLNSQHMMVNTMLVDGASSMPSPGGSTETGHAGNGYARISKLSDGNGIDFDYTGSVQSYSLGPGSYKLEVWGAQGGHRSPETSSYYYQTEGRTGRGGYSVGTIKLTETTTVYVNVGGEGNNGTCDSYSNICSGGFNGGGYRYMYKGGGGGTDIRIGSNSLYARVIVAGGGGSDGSSSKSGGAGGGYSGVESNPDYYVHGSYGGTGGGQTGTADPGNIRTVQNTSQLAFSDDYLYGYNYEFGGFGFGGAGLYSRTGYGGAGGGGWYGGNGVDPDCCYDDERGGGGGSGYVYTSWSYSDYPSGCLLNSKHYLKNADVFDGDSSFFDPEGHEEIGHVGNGYARITPVPDVVDDSELSHTDYSYTGSVQAITLEPGKYKLEVWGAQGGYRSSSAYGGYGGYSVGILELATRTNAYIYVGGQGNSGTCNSSTNICTGGFNGGGYRYMYKGGGGGTDIRLGTDSLYSRVIVAGGGGSDGSTSRAGGYAGGEVGERRSESWAASTYCGYGGTQLYSGYDYSTYRSSPNTSNLIGTSASYYYGGFGFGGAGTYDLGGYGGAGGGGWYGGTGVAPDCCVDDERGGGGGSGYVYTSSTYTRYPAGGLLNASYFLTDASTHSGNSTFKAPGGGNEKGHRGNGFARITVLERPTDVEEVFDFDYTGSCETMTLTPGDYQFEAWGAQGGDSSDRGANRTGAPGGYSYGELTLTETTSATICVGGRGAKVLNNINQAGGFNGGGEVINSTHGTGSNAVYRGTGGGASDVRLNGSSLYHRLIVAGGGGGAGGNFSWSSCGFPTTESPAVGGGVPGGKGENMTCTGSSSVRYGARGGNLDSGGVLGNYESGSAVQTATSGTFGNGGRGGTGSVNVFCGGAGGGGWFGGGGGAMGGGDGGGGSGWVFTDANSGYTSPSITGGTWQLDAKYYLANAYTKTGEDNFVDPDGLDVTGHYGNGHVRITKVVPPGPCGVSTIGVDGEISDTSCGHTSDSVTTAPRMCVNRCYNYANCTTGSCLTCDSFTETYVGYVPNYGSIYSYECSGSLYTSSLWQYVCEDFCVVMDEGTATNTEPYSGGRQMAKAMDICSEYNSSDPASYGLIEAYITRDNSMSGVSSRQVNILSGMKRYTNIGTTPVKQIPPRGGETFALMSSGWATDAYHDPYPEGSYGYCHSALPPVYAAKHPSSLASNPGCPSPDAYHCDGLRFHLKLKAPPGAQGFSFDFRFFSYEYPGWVCSYYNDFFLALLTDESGNVIVDTNDNGLLTDEDGNIAFDELRNPITINSAGMFTTCSGCSAGTADLYGFTNSGSNGATGWLTTTVPITSGKVFNLDFYIWDTSDSAYDSTVILDNFKWRTTQTVIGTGLSTETSFDPNTN